MSKLNVKKEGKNIVPVADNEVKKAITVNRHAHEDITIPVDAPGTQFADFLVEDNKRIFFSANYGAGKTYFLNKFFKERSELYDVYHLSPHRYQISSNENIIELLKYDVLVELLRLYPDAFDEGKEQNGFFQVFAAFCKDRGGVNAVLQSVIDIGGEALSVSPDPFLQLISKLRRPISQLLTLDREFQVFKEQYCAGEQAVVEEFVKKVNEDNPGTTDYISYLLQTKIAKLKGKKKSVLILDDFDRMDPEHIFRILNILSVHMYGHEKNELGFDHIIIVGDLRNLKNIFHHKYGAKTDFAGYFDKFFTTEPYIFDNATAVKEALPHLLQAIKCETDLREAFSRSGITAVFLKEALTNALDSEGMNLRQLFKPINHHFHALKEYDRKYSNSRALHVNMGIELLSAIYGGSDNLIVVLDKIRDKASSHPANTNLLFDVYTDFSDVMLKQMISLKADERLKWQGYSLHAQPNDYAANEFNFRLDHEKEAHARFFYDVLYEYVRSDSYKRIKSF